MLAVETLIPIGRLVPRKKDVMDTVYDTGWKSWHYLREKDSDIRAGETAVAVVDEENVALI